MGLYLEGLWEFIRNRFLTEQNQSVEYKDGLHKLFSSYKWPVTLQILVNNCKRYFNFNLVCLLIISTFFKVV